MDHIHPYFIVYSFIALEYIIGKLGVFNFLRLLVCIGACWWVAMTAQAVAQRHTANRFVTQISLNDSRSRVRRAASAIDLPAQECLRSPVLQLTATQVTREPLIQATRETEEPQPPVSHQAEESQPLVPRQAEECQPPASLQDEESHQGKESQQPAPRQGKEPHPPALWWSMELTLPTSWLPLEPGELSPRPPSSLSLLLASIFKTPWMPKEAHRKVDGKWLRVMESPSGAFIAWPVMKGWDLRRQFRFSPEAEAFADQAHNRAASQAPAPLAGAGQRDMATTSGSLGSMLAEVFSPDMVHSDYWNFSSAGGQYREWSVDPINLDPRLFACFVAKHLVAKLPWQYLFNCGAVEDLYMAMQYCDMVARGALLFYGDKEHHAGERHADNQPAEPTTAIVTVASGETTSAPLSNSDRDDPSSITGVPSSEPLTTSGQSVEPVSADGATECAGADAKSVVTVAQPSGSTASIGGSSSESPTSNSSDDTVHTCVAGKVAEDDGLRCESPAGNVAIGLSGVLPASNTSDEAGAAHGTSVNNTSPKVRRNSAPSVATEAASQSARRRASSNNGVIIAAPTARLDEPVSTALVATQAPIVTEASKGVAEPTVMCTVVRSAMPHPGRSSKEKVAEAVDVATNSSNEPSGSSSRAVVAEQAVGPIANTIDSVQPTVPISNGVWSGGEVATQADEPYASSDVGHGAMLIDASSQQGEPSATDGVLQDVELPAMDMAMQDVEPPAADMVVEDAKLTAATMAVEGAEPFVADAEMLNIASTSHVVVPPATDMVVEYMEPPAADTAVVGVEPFVVDAAMQDAEMPNVASTSRLVVPPTAADVEMEAVVPAVPDMEVEERPQADAGSGIRREKPLAAVDAATQDKQPSDGGASMDVVPVSERVVARHRQRRPPGSNFVSGTQPCFNTGIGTNPLFPGLAEALAGLPPPDTSHIDPVLLASTSIGFNNGLIVGMPFIDPVVVANKLMALEESIAADAPLLNPGNGSSMLSDLSFGPVASGMLPNAGVAANMLPGLDANITAGMPLVNSGNGFGVLPGFCLGNPAGTVPGLGMETANTEPLLDTSAQANVPPSSGLDKPNSTSSAFDAGVLNSALLPGASTQSYTLEPLITEPLPNLDHVDMADLVQKCTNIGTSNDALPVNYLGTGALLPNALCPGLGAIPPLYPALDAYASDLINGCQGAFTLGQFGLGPLTVPTAADAIAGAVPGMNQPLANLNGGMPLLLGGFDYPWLNPGCVGLEPNHEGLAFKETEEIAYNLAPPELQQILGQNRLVGNAASTMPSPPPESSSRKELEGVSVAVPKDYNAATDKPVGDHEGSVKRKRAKAKH
ncbi:hypothetical protein GGI06_000611 [Coemansia sp. S85]|nr:hypothetical protein GGI06_000611 [Coemansia sp. S85]